MKEYETLVETLVKMSEITRPTTKPSIDPTQKRFDKIQHGICDLLEDAAVAIDALMQKVTNEERTHVPSHG